MTQEKSTQQELNTGFIIPEMFYIRQSRETFLLSVKTEMELGFMSKNTKIAYLYRDASNYKTYNEIIINGCLDQRDISQFLKDSAYFIPSEVGLKDLQPCKFSVDDHIWHEIEFMEATDEESTLNISTDILYEKFKKAHEKEWNEYAVFERKCLL